MYSKYEIPFFSATLFYYDNDYRKETSSKVLTILEKHGMFPHKTIYAEKLTGNHNIIADDRAREIFVNAYAEKDVFQIAMESDDMESKTEQWWFRWNFTFYKSSERKRTGTFKPWNVLTINSTYERLNDPATFDSFMLCYKELIEMIQPIYATVDDCGNEVRLTHKKQPFTPTKIQEIFWGNYFGHDLCELFKSEKLLLEMPAYKVQKIGNGVYFELTDHIRSFNSIAAKIARKRIKCYLKKIRR